MIELPHVLAYCAAAFCIGATLAVGLLIKLAGRHSEPGGGEGCMALMVWLIGIVIALSIIYLPIA